MLTELGVTVNGQSSAILSILVLGAGTDYALLLVSRYREELRKHEDKHEAMALALRTAGPAIVASGATVICALLCLTLAEVEGTAGLGPIGAMGIARRDADDAHAAPGDPHDLRPPLVLAAADRSATTTGSPTSATRAPTRRTAPGGASASGSRAARAGSGSARAALLAVGALGLLTIDTGLTQADSYRDRVESLEGQDLLAKSFPAGAIAATEVIVPNDADAGARDQRARGRRPRRAGGPDRRAGPAGPAASTSCWSPSPTRPRRST